MARLGAVGVDMLGRYVPKEPKTKRFWDQASDGPHREAFLPPNPLILTACHVLVSSHPRDVVVVDTYIRASLKITPNKSISIVWYLE